MNNLDSQFDNLKAQYEDIFFDSVAEVQQDIEGLRPVNFDGEFFQKYDKNTVGFFWQTKILEYLKDRVVSLNAEEKITKYRKEYDCKCCGLCCRFAVSEFSPEELHEKAFNGDNYAQQFVATFVPYESTDEARKIYPEYVTLLEKLYDGGFYFYHCPNITDDNKCPDYENRPQICRDFPDNPVSFLPFSCGFREWKLKSEPVSLKLKVETDIYNFYRDNLKDLYK